MGTKRKRKNEAKEPQMPVFPKENNLANGNEKDDGQNPLSDQVLPQTSSPKWDRIRVLTGSLDSVLSGYDIFLDPFHVEQVYRESAHIMAITAMAHGGRYLATGAKDEKIWLWDLKKRLTLGELFDHGNDITWLGFCDKYLVSCDAGGMIMVTRTKDWEPVARMKAKKRVNSFAIHPSGRIGLSVGADWLVYLWNMMTGRKASINRIGGEGISIAWNASGDAYAILFDRKLVQYGVDAKVQFEMEFNTRLHCMRYVRHQGEEHVLIGAEDGTLRFVRQGKEVQSLKAHEGRIKSISILEHYLASASSDGTVKLYDLERDVFVGEHFTGERLTCVLSTSPSVEQFHPISPPPPPPDTHDSDSE